MLKNSTYNLMEAASVISRGLHRYDTFKKDSHGCQHCQQVWDHMRKSDEELLNRIVSHMREHIDQDEGAKRAAA
jgi:hypothetical protein